MCPPLFSATLSLGNRSIVQLFGCVFHVGYDVVRNFLSFLMDFYNIYILPIGITNKHDKSNKSLAQSLLYRFIFYLMVSLFRIRAVAYDVGSTYLKLKF